MDPGDISLNWKFAAISFKEHSKSNAQRPAIGEEFVEGGPNCSPCMEDIIDQDDVTILD